MKKYIYTSLIFCSVLLSACEKFIEIDPPVDRFISKTVYQNNETAISAVTGLYADIMRNTLTLPYTIAINAGLYGDELEYKQNNPLNLALYKNTLNARESRTHQIWTSVYNFIYQSNSIISGLQGSASISEDVKKQLTGEALFVRAFCHFHLVNFYGDVPVVTTTDYSVNGQMPRMSMSSAYAQIEEDLIKSKSLLSAKYVAANSVSESTDRVRANTYAASALLARVYLYQKKWQKTVDEANDVIESGLYALENLDLVFKRTSREVILQFELANGLGLFNSYEANYFRLTNVPSPTSYFRAAVVSPSLYEKFSLTDRRKNAWFGIFRSGNIEYVYPAKYKSTSSTLIDEYSTPLRLAEIYLIRAEAQAQLNNLSAAINDTDRIRLRAGIPLLKDVSPNASQSQLLESISEERQRELFCEWGLRWMDIRRSDRISELMTAVAARKGSTWQPYMSLWPIPFNDIINNNKLIQNEGYN